MTRAQQIKKLESILARVLGREASRAQPGVPAVVSPVSAPVTDVDAEFEWPTRPPPPPDRALALEVRAVDDTRAEEDARPEAPSAQPALAGDIAGDASFESRERLVAARQASPPAGTRESAADGGVDAIALADASASETRPSEDAVLSERPRPRLESEPPPDVEVEMEDEMEDEQPPASSRRPLGPPPEEQIARIAFGSDAVEPTRHTPPPESGRLPSAAQSAPEVDPGAQATVDPFEARTNDHAIDVIVESVRPPPSRLVVIETRAVLPSEGEVAEMANEHPSPQPETFVELLRVSLTL